MRWLLPLGLALTLHHDGWAQVKPSEAPVGSERRGFFSWFTSAGRSEPLRVLAPGEINRIMREDHRRAESLLERDLRELRRHFQGVSEQRRSTWETRWAIRDEAVARKAAERARERQLAAEREAAERRTAEAASPAAPGVIQKLLDRPPVKEAGKAISTVTEGVTDAVRSRIIAPLKAQSERMSPGYFALLLAGAFFVPSLGMASLILGFINLRARFLRRSMFFFLVAGLCSAAVAGALRSPLVQASVSPAAVLLPEKWEVAGRTFEGVRYTGHDGRRLHFRHEGGAASVPLADLPEAWQDDLGYDPARIAAEDARAADAAARDAKRRSIEATAILATATVVEATDDGFVIADLVPDKSEASLAVSDSGCAFLATEVRGLRPGTEVKLKLYRDGERRIPGGWGTVEMMPAYTDSAERLLAAGEGMN